MKKLAVLILMVLAVSSVCGATDLVIEQVVLRDMNSTEDWPNNATVSKCVAADDADIFMSGSQALRLTTTDSGVATARHEAASTTDVRNGMGVWFYVDEANYPLLSTLKLRIREGAGNTKGYTATYYDDTDMNWISPDHWNYRWVSKEAFAGFADPTAWTTTYPVRSVELQISREGDPNVSVVFGNVVTDNASKGGVVLCFDDAKDGVYDYAFRRIEAYGSNACVGVISGSIGNNNFMTLAELQELYDAGWDLTNHTFDGSSFAGLTKAQALEQIQDGKQYLLNNGFYRGSNVLIWTGNVGYPTNKTDWYGSDLAAPYTKMIRGTSFHYPESDVIGGTPAMGGASPWTRDRWDQIPHIGIYSTDANETWVGSYQTTVNNIITNGGVAVLYMHDVRDEDITNPGSVDIELGLLEDMLAWLKAQEIAGNLKVITFTEWYAIANKNGGAEVFLDNKQSKPSFNQALGKRYKKK